MHIGGTYCPVCLLRGHGSEEHTAWLGEDNRISCVSCGRISYPIPPCAVDIYRQPQEVRNVVAELISSERVEGCPFRLIRVEDGEGYGACLEQATESIMTSVDLRQSVEPEIDHLRLQYTDGDVRALRDDASGTAKTLGQEYDPEETIGCPVPIGANQAVRKLIQNGFRYLMVDLDGPAPTITCVMGTEVAGGKAILGIRAQVSWQTR